MNISRRSLVFSFILHASLVLTGTFWLLLSSRGQGASAPLKSDQKVWKVTPVALSTPTPKASKAPIAPPARKTRPTPTRVKATRAVSPPTKEVTRPIPQRPVASTPRTSSAAVKPLEVPRAYPTARTSGRRSAPQAGAPRSRRRPREAAPLWSPSEQVSPTPESGPQTSVGDGGGESAGVVSEPTPIGVIDPGADVASFKGLASGYVEVEFEISAKGDAVKVELLTGTGVTQVDADLVAYFKTFRWKPKTVGGVAVVGSQTMDFQVESRN